MKNPLLAKVTKLAILVPVSIIILVACSSAIAQRGGKAEPNRIEFKRGTTSTIISGTVPRGRRS